MDIDNLIRMANRIAEFFDAMPDRDEAELGVADHLRKFWEPRMRSELLEHADRGDQFHPLLRQTLANRRDRIAGAPAAGN